MNFLDIIKGAFYALEYILEMPEEAKKGNYPKYTKPNKNADALEAFIHNIHTGQDIAPLDSRRNIEKAVVEILHYNQHSSNGLMITSDGYFLTARHCLDRKNLKDYSIKTSTGRISDIKQICIVSKKDDIVLAKANVPGKPEPLHYRLFANETSQEYARVASLSRWDGKLGIKRGYVTRPKIDHGVCNSTDYFKGHFDSTLATRPGDSGSPIIASDGSFCGIISSGTGISGTAARSHRALELISFYANYLRK